MQYQSFSRLEEHTLQLLVAGSVVVGLASLSDLQSGPTGAKVVFIVALGFYGLLALTTIGQLWYRKRRLSTGPRELWTTYFNAPPRQILHGLTFASVDDWEVNAKRLLWKGRLLRAAILLATFETLAVGSALALVAFSEPEIGASRVPHPCPAAACLAAQED